MNATVGVIDILIDAINKKYDYIRDLNSLNVTIADENFEDMIPVIDSIIDDENNHIGKLQQLVDLLSDSDENIEEGKQDVIEIIDNSDEFVESITSMKKKLILSENFDNVIDDVQAVADPVFVGANEEHDDNKKKYEDAMKENEKTALETVPKEEETGKKITSKSLKSMHLSEDLFSDYSSARPGTTKALSLLDDGIADAEGMLDELLRYLPDEEVKEFIDYYAENFLGIFEDEEISESIKIKEDLNIIKDKGAFLDWLSEHEQAEDDACRHFKTNDLSQISVKKLEDWLSEHEQLEDDYRRFNESCNLKKNKSIKIKEDLSTDFAQWCADNLSEYIMTEFVDLKNSEIRQVLKLVLNHFSGSDFEESLKNIKESLSSSGEQLEFNRAIYNAIADVFFEYDKKGLQPDKNDLEYALEWFDLHFWDAYPDDFDESLTESFDWKYDRGSAAEDMTSYSCIVSGPKGKRHCHVIDDHDGNISAKVYENGKQILDKSGFSSIKEARKFLETMKMDESLTESLQYSIAKEQIKRFIEGKMPKNWTVDSYLNRITEKNHISKKEAKQLREWYSTLSK